VTNLLWVIAIVVLQGVIAGLAKKADAKAKAAKAAKLAESQQGAARESAGVRSARSQSPFSNQVTASATPSASPISPVPARSARDAVSVGGAGSLGGSNAADEQRRARQAALERARANASLSTPDERGASMAQRKDRAKGKAQKQPPKPPRAPVYREPEEGEGDSAPDLGRVVAMFGAARASAPAVQPSAGAAATPTPVAGRAGLQAAELRSALRNPSDLRKALILGEILGAPRSQRPI
jgi:hypothetical protein